MTADRPLGNTGLRVPRLCFGTLALSAAQAAGTPESGGRLLAYAYGRGVVFWDTAEIYGTYPHIREGIRQLGGKLPAVSSRSYAYDRAGAAASFEKARRETGLDVIDLFMLHEQVNVLTLLGHAEALKYYVEMREKGFLRAIGISTHAVEPVQAAAFARGGIDPLRVFPRVREFDLGLLREIDVVFPILNRTGIGLLDGSADDMLRAAAAARSAGIGVLGMKLLGGGNLLRDFRKAVEYGLSLDFVDSYAVGMQNEMEVDINVRLFSGEPVTEEILDTVRSRKRRLDIESWCTGCGACVARCGAGALRIEGGRAVVDGARCVLCSYCAPVCPEFAIRVL